MSQGRHEFKAKAAALLLGAALGLAPGCGTTKATGEASTADESAQKAKLAPSDDAVDAALAREGEKWMIDQAKRRAVAQPAANAVTRPAALPVERR